MRKFGVLALVLASSNACKTRDDDSALLADDGGSAAAACDAAIGAEEIKTTCKPVPEVTMDIGNLSAFRHKLELIDRAQRSVDLAYFIYTFDHSSSELNAHLLAKAKAGVKVRILADAMMALPNLRELEALVKASETQGAGSVPLAIRLFRPIPDEVWQDLESWGFSDREAFGAAMAGFEVDQFGKLLLSNSYLRNNASFRLMLSVLLPGSVPPGDVTSLFANASALKFPKEPTIEGLLAAMFQPVLDEFKDKTPPPTFRAGAWMRMMKRMHHKVLVVDGKAVQGGGRNVEDPYHLETDLLTKVQLEEGGAEGHPAFMDADFYLESETLAAEALKGFESYWNCLPDAAGKLGTACSSRIPAQEVKPEAGTDYAPFIAAAKSKSLKYGQLVDQFQIGPASLHNGTFKAKDAAVAYVENRMHPVRPLLPLEELSRYNAAWANLMKATKPGQEIIVHNAYLYFTPRIMLELSQAVRRGVKVRIITNSTISSPQGFVGHIAKAQFRYLMNINQDLVKIYEYTTKNLSLHAKVEVVGDYVIIGATNADPRSELLDTQNGVVVGPNPAGGSMAADYTAWIDRLVKQTQFVKPLTKAEIDEFVPRFDEAQGTCPVADQQKKLLCFVGHLVDLSAESDELGGKAARAFLNLAFIML